MIRAFCAARENQADLKTLMLPRADAAMQNHSTRCNFGQFDSFPRLPPAR